MYEAAFALAALALYLGWLVYDRLLAA